MTANRRQREERWARCREYLRKAGSIPAAIKLARKDHFSQNTSVWITALGQLLAAGITQRVQQVKARCVNCGTERWLNAGDEPICEKDYGPMYATAARVKTVRVSRGADPSRSRGTRGTP